MDRLRGRSSPWSRWRATTGAQVTSLRHVWKGCGSSSSRWWCTTKRPAISRGPLCSVACAEICLEAQLERDLHPPVAGLSRNLTKRRALRIGIGIVPVGMIREVKNLPSELRLDPLCCTDVLKQGDVPALEARPPQDIASGVPECAGVRLGKGLRVEIEITVRSAFRE